MIARKELHMSATLHLHFLGDFLAVSGDTPLTSLSVPRQQSLLAYLVNGVSPETARKSPRKCRCRVALMCSSFLAIMSTVYHTRPTKATDLRKISSGSGVLNIIDPLANLLLLTYT